MYQRIDGNNWRHIWIMGDLHGCHQRLMRTLRDCRFNPYQDLLISVGDIIDRGPESLPCLRLLNRRWFKAVRGNHEQMAIDSLEAGDMSLWTLNGGVWFTQLPADAQQEARALLRACDALPWIIELHCESGKHIIAHADYPAREYKWQKAVEREAVLWRRERLNALLAGKGEAITGADHFWFGHTPLEQRMDTENLHYIDTGTVFSGNLTLARVQ